MNTITDLLGAQVEAQLQVAEWEAEFQRAFFAPVEMAGRVRAKAERGRPPNPPPSTVGGDADDVNIERLVQLLRQKGSPPNVPPIPTA